MIFLPSYAAILKKVSISWVDAAGPLTGNADDNANSGYTHRVLIAAAAISNSGLTYIRVTFESSSVEAWTIDKAYIGQAADAGDAYDFQTTPTQLLFSGSPGFAIALGTQKVSDQTTFTIPAGKNIIVSFHTSGDSSHDSIRRKTSQANWTTYYKSGDDAATINATGYGTIATTSEGVMRIEAGS